jgi:hypothetical protein
MESTARTWYFGQLRAASGVEADVEFERLRLADEGEREAVKRAASTLNRWVSMSPYYRLALAHEEFEEFLRASVPTGPWGPAAGQVVYVRVQSVILGWLAQFRAFQDHTAHSVSQQFGKDSAAWRVWDQARTTEFDSNASYRFADKLRNYSQHAADPVHRIRQSAHVATAEGQPDTRRLILEFDPVDLLADKHMHWGRFVDADLRSLDGPIPVELVLRSAVASCERIYVSLIAEIRPTIDNALAALEAYAAYGPNAVFMEVGDDYGIAASTLKVESVRLELARHARMVLETVGA